MAIVCIVLVSKAHEKTKNNNEFTCPVYPKLHTVTFLACYISSIMLKIYLTAIISVYCYIRLVCIASF